MISGRDGELAAAIMKNIGNTTEQYGIELLSFETKQLDLPSDNKAAVYERMISERENISATYTAEGSSEAQKIRNTTDKEVNVLLSEANKNAEILIAIDFRSLVAITRNTSINTRINIFHAKWFK